MAKPKMEQRSTYKWWKGLYDTIRGGSEQAVMSYVFNRLDQGTFRSMRNSQFNSEAIEYIFKQERSTNKALSYALKEVEKWEK